MKKMMTILGAFLVIIAVLLIIIARQGFIFDKYRKYGKTKQATIVKKYTKRSDQLTISQHKPTRYGAKTKMSYLLDITFFSNGSAKGGKFITTWAFAGNSSLAGLAKGNNIEVIYLADDPKGTAILKTVVEEGLQDKTLQKKYREEGVTVQATVDQTNPGQRTVRVMFMSSLSLQMGDYNANTLDVDKSVWETVNQGEKIDVVYLPDKPGEKVFAAQMIERGSVNFKIMFGLAVFSFLSGIGLMWFFRTSEKKKRTVPTGEKGLTDEERKILHELMQKQAEKEAIPQSQKTPITNHDKFAFPIGIPDELLLCPYCFGIIDEQAVICPSCKNNVTNDAPVEMTVGEYNNAARIACSYCGKSKLRLAKICPSCGK